MIACSGTPASLQTEDLAMKAKAQTRAAKIEEVASRDSATLIVGLVMTAVFVGMLLLNAIS